MVTYGVDGEWRCAIDNSFTSVSMIPPLILVSIKRSPRALSGLSRSLNGFLVPSDSTGNMPRLLGCVAWIECDHWQPLEAGDHILFIGRVTAHSQRRAEALLFYRAISRSGYSSSEVINLCARNRKAMSHLPSKIIQPIRLPGAELDGSKNVIRGKNGQTS